MSGLQMVLWDVQHGSAAYIRTPGGQHIAIDLGVGSYGVDNREFSPLRFLEYEYGVVQLDALIITHPHRDHLDDIFSLSKMLPPRVMSWPRGLSERDVRRGNRSGDKEVLDEYLRLTGCYAFPIAANVNPFSPNNNGGVGIQHFSPRSCSASNINDHSIVSVISYCGLKVLFPGDNEACSWNELLGRADFLSAIRGTDVLVAAHHGRDSGFCPKLFNYIDPFITLVSDGRFCDTSATSRYSRESKGLTVYKRSGGSQLRKCLTTRKDGVIVIELGIDGGRPYIIID